MSEIVPQAELNLALSSKVADRSQCAGAHAEVAWGYDAGPGKVELWRVKNVEELGPELKLMALDRKPLEQREIKIVNGWTSKRTSCNIPNSSRGWSRKGSDVELLARNDNWAWQGRSSGKDISS